MHSAKRTWTIRRALSWLAALSAIFLANKIMQARLILPEDILQMHENITVLWSQGQLAIDLFAPISHVAGAKPWVDNARLWIWPLNAGIWLGNFGTTPWTLRSRFCWLSLLATAIAVVSIQGMNNSYAEDYILVSCDALADGLLYLALILTISDRRPGSYLWYGLHGGLADALIWSSFGLGGNMVDFYLVWLQVIFWRIHDFAKTLPDRRTTMLTILAKAIAGFSMSLLAWPLVYTIIMGNVIAWSESASNINHNLHYLSPAARRHITPFPSVIDVQWSGTTNTALGVYKGAEYTLYIPGAGFLWSDNLVWAQRMPKGKNDSGNNTADAWAIDEARRVSFQDKNVRRHPWLIEPVLKQHRMTTMPEGILRSGASVKMMDPDSKEYLCVNPGQHVVSEAGYFQENDVVNEDEDAMVRIAIGVRNETTPRNCEWRIYYDMFRDGKGIIVFNEQNNCRLATTFRSLPVDISGPKHNDRSGFLEAPQQLEASCTVHANDASSHLYAIERRIGGSKASRRRVPTNTVLRSFIIGFEYHRAVYKLETFQARYSDLQRGQDRPVPRARGSAHRHDLLILGCILYLCAWIGLVLARKRGITAALRIQPGMEGVFVLLHIELYYLRAFDMPYTSRVAALMAISGSARLLQEALCMPK